jgi:hypothetical protein|nr:MAG TPA: hypothetical protein [Caudoviricetes sp.]
MPETVTKFANLQTLEKLSTLIKGYVDGNVSKKMDSFTPGQGLSLEGGILKVTLDTTLFKVVESLPAAPAASDANKIFLVRDSSSKASDNVYVEYMYVNKAWEEVGRQQQAEVDLEPYLKKNELTATVSSSSISIQKGSEKLAGVSFNASDFQGVTGSGNLNVSLKDILEAAVPSGMYKLAIDKKGRVTGYTAIQLSDLTALGVAKQVDLDTLSSNLSTETSERKQATADLHDEIETKADKTALATTNANVDKKVNKSDIVQVTGQSTTSVMSQKAVSDELSTKVNKTDIVQSTGTSTTSVMSQKAVTDSVNAEKTAREAADNAEKTAREAADTALSERTTVLETKLANYQVITDEEVTAMAEKVFGPAQS